MNYVRYIDIKERRLANVRCMKCNTFLYNMQDHLSVRAALACGLPHRVSIDLSDGSYTDVVLCHTCDVAESDIPKLENSMKFAWLYEFIQAGRPREVILDLAKRIKPLKMLHRREICLTPIH